MRTKRANMEAQLHSPRVHVGFDYFGGKRIWNQHLKLWMLIFKSNNNASNTTFWTTNIPDMLVSHGFIGNIE